MLSITQPDDWHLHLRDGTRMRDVLLHSASCFGRAIVMPNLKPPVITTADALSYRKRIIDALPTGSAFEPLMTLYLTDNTSPGEIFLAKRSGFVHAVKYYPAGATTNSDSGVTDISKCSEVLEAMSESEMPLLVHGEVTDASVDVFDREKVFMERVLEPLTIRYPELKIVFEHITTKDAVEFVKGKNLGATITAHHLLLNRNAMFSGGIRPHHYCLPVLKREVHRQALLEAAISGNPKFFLGTDSAPHSKSSKEASCGCAGIYTAHAAIELYAEAFEEAGALEKLEAFASFHGADFYGLPRNEKRVELLKEEWAVPEHYSFGDEQLVPLRAGTRLSWKCRLQRC
ncbi:MAG TPA: dihydroorotase [Burkholderiales bacterium]|nr:dihydroorotase [Burkholderiales bacterium]